MERDALPQAADYLVRLEGVETAIVFGIVDDAIQLSARSPDPRIHIGNMLGEVFEDVGSGGGTMTQREVKSRSASLPTIDDAQLLELVEQVITARLVARLEHTDKS